MKLFNENDIKEAIRIVLQDWLDNEHGTNATLQSIEEYYEKFMQQKRLPLIGKELQAWLNEHPDLVKVSGIQYLIKYKGVDCMVIITITQSDNLVAIMPRYKTDDIGNGVGQFVKLEFKRETDNNQMTGEELNVKL